MNSNKLKEITDFYSKRKSKLLLSSGAQRPTKLGYWAASDPKQLFELFQKLDLDKHNSFVDLGSGDGVAIAVASLFTKAAGIEIDEELNKVALDARDKLGLSYDIITEDYLGEDLSRYDFIFINPDNYFYKLERKLVDEFKGTFLLAENMFRPLTLVAKAHVSVMGSDFSIYELGR